MGGTLGGREGGERIAGKDASPEDMVWLEVACDRRLSSEGERGV